MGRGGCAAEVGWRGVSWARGGTMSGWLRVGGKNEIRVMEEL